MNRKHYVCTIEGCGRKHRAHGLCSMHNHRMIRHGDPLFVNPKCKKAADKRMHNLTDLIGCWVIELTRNKWARVDTCDVSFVSQYKGWYCSDTGYALTDTWCAKTKKCDRLRMHRLITGVPDGMFVDHIDGDPLNNTRQNLRICSHSQNMKNQKGSRVGYKGIYRCGKNRWQASVMCDRKKHYIGSFATPEEAAQAYDVKARELFGEFACLNFC